MKVFSLAMVTLLLAAVLTGSSATSFRSYYGTCCSKNMFVKNKISTSAIRSYEETSPDCSRRAMIVKLTKGKKVCVDPAEDWFQNYLQRQKPKNASA